MRHFNICFRILFLAGAASTCAIWQSALAQATGPEAASAGGQIEEVIVTARKREENLQKVPLSVSVQSGLTLQQHQITDIYSLQSLTPSLQVTSSVGTAGDPEFAIRGTGTAVLGISLESSVGLVVDDVPMGRTPLANIQLFDINNVETLKGPQGMLFGKNAAAGLINVVTNDPQPNETDFIAHAQYGAMNTASSGNSGTIDVVANLPVSSDLTLRVDGFFTHYDAFIKDVVQPNEFLGQDQGGARVKLLWEPTSWARILLSADYALENGPGEGVQSFRFTDPPNGSFFDGIATTLNSLVGITASPRNILMAAGGGTSEHFAVGGVSLKTEFDVGGGYSVTNVASYRRFNGVQQSDSDLLPVNFGDFNPTGQNFSQETEELRLTSPADQRFTFQGGLFFMKLDPRENISFSYNLGIPGPPWCLNPPTCSFVSNAPGFFGGSSAASEPQESKAAFFEGNYKLLDSLRVTAGVRYTHDLENYSLLFGAYNPPTAICPFCALPPAPPNTPVLLTNKAVNDNVSYRTSLDYDITDEVMAYVGYGKGYKGSGFNAENASVVGPELPVDYEVGLKSTLLGDRLRLNLALFDEIFHGFQGQVEERDPRTGIFVDVVENAGKLTSKGVEVEATALPMDGLTIDGGLTYNHTEVTPNPGSYFPCYPNEPMGPAALASGAFNAANVCQDLSALGGSAGPFPGGGTNVTGNQLQNAPEWTESVTIRYEEPVWKGWTGFVQGNGYFRSPYNFNFSRDPNTEVGASAIFNASIGAQQEDGHLGFSLYVRNLTDKRIPVFIYIPGFSEAAQIDLARGDYEQQFNADSFRTIGLTLDYHM